MQLTYWPWLAALAHPRPKAVQFASAVARAAATNAPSESSAAQLARLPTDVASTSPAASTRLITTNLIRASMMNPPFIVLLTRRLGRRPWEDIPRTSEVVQLPFPTGSVGAPDRVHGSRHERDDDVAERRRVAACRAERLRLRGVLLARKLADAAV